MLLWKSRHLPAHACPRRSRPLVLPEICSNDSQRSHLGRWFGRHGRVPTRINLNPRTVFPWTVCSNSRSRWGGCTLTFCVCAFCVVYWVKHMMVSWVLRVWRFSFHAPPQTPLHSILGLGEGQFEPPLMTKWICGVVLGVHNNMLTPKFEVPLCYSSKSPNYNENTQVGLADVYTTPIIPWGE